MGEFEKKKGIIIFAFFKDYALGIMYSGLAVDEKRSRQLKWAMV